MIVRVVALEYAKAEEIAGILNEFIGAAKSETKTARPPAGPRRTAEPGQEGAAEAAARRCRTTSPSRRGRGPHPPGRRRGEGQDRPALAEHEDPRRQAHQLAAADGHARATSPRWRT